MLVINSLLSILSNGLPVARRHGKITVHVTLPHNMDVGHQLSIIYFVYWSSSGKKHGKITVHATLSYNMDVGHQLSIIYFVYWSSSGKKTW